MSHEMLTGLRDASLSDPLLLNVKHYVDALEGRDSKGAEEGQGGVIGWTGLEVSEKIVCACAGERGRARVAG